MDIDIKLLKTFLAVAEKNNLTKAAMTIGRTQSAISQQISKLETLLGSPLFIRHNKNISLTLQGEKFIHYAKKMVTLHNEMVDHFKDPDLMGEINFGMPEDFASFFLSDVLKTFKRLHPRILINVECDLTLNLFDKFNDNKLDLVLLKMAVSRGDISGTEVWSEKLEWVGEETISFRETVPLVLSPEPCVYRKRGIDALNRGSKDWNIVFSSHSHGSIIEAVRAGLGITILPKKMVPRDLKIIQNQQLPPLEDTHISLLKHAPSNDIIGCFESFILEKFKA